MPVSGNFRSVLNLLLWIVLAMTLCAWLINRAALHRSESARRMLAAENASQAQLLVRQVFHFNHFNHIAQRLAKANVNTGAASNRVIIQYREILRHEKSCDLPVPVAIANGLFSYANRLRASALRTPSGNVDITDSRPVTSATLTYCQAVLWLTPLLAAIEKGNDKLAAIREIEQYRQSTKEGEKHDLIK